MLLTQSLHREHMGEHWDVVISNIDMECLPGHVMFHQSNHILNVADIPPQLLKYHTRQQN